MVIEDKRNHQRLEFPTDDPGRSVEQTIEHWHRLIRRPTGRGSTFVNCWYQEAEESEAMWKLFAGEKYGVALRTTAAQLVGSFTERLPDYLGCVEYLAYDKDLMPVFRVSSGLLQAEGVHARTGGTCGGGAGAAC